MKVAQKWLCIQQQQMPNKSATYILLWSTFTAKWMEPDPKKVQALQDLPTPQNQKELQ